MAELTIAFVDLTGSVSVFETLGNDRAAAAVTRLTQWIGKVDLLVDGRDALLYWGWSFSAESVSDDCGLTREGQGRHALRTAG